MEENVAEVLESLDLEQALFESAKRVTHVCMDIRRGENVLIVCDPTTGEIGQALHRSATERSDRVLLIVMPRGRHHGEEPCSSIKFNETTTNCNRSLQNIRLHTQERFAQLSKMEHV